MTIHKLLIANRAEIAVRVARAADELGIASVAIFAEDDAGAPHCHATTERVGLVGRGAAAYLSIDGVLAAAAQAGADAVHPGYGFLAERSDFAQRCEAAGLTFVGPSAAAMNMLGDKIESRALARRLDVPTVGGSAGAVDVGEAEQYLAELGGPMVIKAAAGGGGRGMAIVRDPSELAETFARCRSEAEGAFGDGRLFVERLIERARHVEVQIIADEHGNVIDLGDRECSVQRRHQKLIEIAPSPNLDPVVRSALATAAVAMGQASGYRSLGTIEFLVDAESNEYAFIEANTRIQVEHTVTEEVTGIDLVQAQIRLAAGESLDDIGLTEASAASPRGFAIQARINSEQMDRHGTVKPTMGTLTEFRVPAGPGVRLDTAAVPGTMSNPNYDSLLAKVIVHSGSGPFSLAVKRLATTLRGMTVAGIETNRGLLVSIAEHTDFAGPSGLGGEIYTRWLDDHVAELVDRAEETDLDGRPSAPPDARPIQPGAQVDSRDPLAILDFFRSGDGPTQGANAATTTPSAPALTTTMAPDIQGPANTEAVRAPIQGTVDEVSVAIGDEVGSGEQVMLIESMKMQHVVTTEIGGIIRQITVEVGDIIYEGHPVVFIEPAQVADGAVDATATIDLDHVRPDLLAFLDRKAITFDESRPEATAKRHDEDKRTIRENIVDLIDPDSWHEYGTLAIARRRSTMPIDELRHKAPADGLVTGIGKINGDKFGEDRSSAMVIAYDEAVWAGSQSGLNHVKFDRAVKVADEFSLPVVFFGEGVGGRSGDTDARFMAQGSGAQTLTYEVWPQLSGKVPLVGITGGWCYAGNASILGCCDVIIATTEAMIGMGGPAVIAGGGLGNYLPEEIGPMSEQVPNGVVDILVADEAEAIQAAQKYLSYFQGRVADWDCADQRELRHAIPENRLRTYDIRTVIELLADTDSVLELRPEFGVGLITAFIRIEGRPIGIIANNNAFLGGAVDSPASDKLCRFAQVCDAFNIPIVSLLDTPGMMVGPEVERTGLVRHCNNIFVNLANARCPRMSIVLRKAYGLAAQAMTMGCTRTGMFTVAWPTGEFGGMNLEASVLLSVRHQLAEIEDIDERADLYEKLVAEAYQRGAALNVASTFEIDDVIDPADTRARIVSALAAVPDSEPLRRGRRTHIDTW